MLMMFFSWENYPPQMSSFTTFSPPGIVSIKLGLSELKNLTVQTSLCALSDFDHIHILKSLSALEGSDNSFDFRIKNLTFGSLTSITCLVFNMYLSPYFSCLCIVTPCRLWSGGRFRVCCWEDGASAQTSLIIWVSPVSGWHLFLQLQHPQARVTKVPVALHAHRIAEDASPLEFCLRLASLIF